MEQSTDRSSLTHALRRLSYAEQRHFVAGIRSMFGCRVQRYGTVIFEMAWRKLSPAERGIIIDHVLKRYESFRLSS